MWFNDTHKVEPQNFAPKKLNIPAPTQKQKLKATPNVFWPQNNRNSPPNKRNLPLNKLKAIPKLNKIFPKKHSGPPKNSFFSQKKSFFPTSKLNFLRKIEYYNLIFKLLYCMLFICIRKLQKKFKVKIFLQNFFFFLFHE